MVERNNQERGFVAREAVVGVRFVAGLVVLAASVFAGVPAQAADEPAVPVGTRIAGRAQPVVQLIRTEYAGQVTVTTYKMNQAAKSRTERNLWALQRQGKIAKDLQGLNKYWLNLLRNNPGTYMLPDKHRVFSTRASALCSGWFATPDGVMVTGAHCVQPGSDLSAGMKAQVLPGVVRQDYLLSLRNFSRGKAVPLDVEMRAILRDIAERWFAAHSTFRLTSTKVTVALAVKGNGQVRNVRNVPAKVMSAGAAYPGRDVAVLKVDGYRNLPSLPLGDERRLRVGDTLYIDGFPGTVSDNKTFTKESQREPTFTEGPMSASRTTTKGVPYLQTQAPAYHGNSGGPVLDATGSVIGILIAGTVDPKTGQIVSGQEYVLPASQVAYQLARHGKKAVASPVTQLYTVALDNYYAGRPLFAQLALYQLTKQFGDHPYAARYTQLARQQLAAAPAAPPAAPAEEPDGESFPWLVVGAAVAGTAVLTAGGMALLLRARRPTPRPAAAPTGPPGPGPIGPGGPGYP